MDLLDENFLSDARIDRDWVARLDEAAAAALPAREQAELDGWRLRADDGDVTRRANSVWARRSGQLPLPEKLARASAWYAERGRRLRFQLSPLSLPAGLAASLQAADWRFHTPVAIMAAPVETVWTRCQERWGPRPDEGVEARQEADEAWLRVYASVLPAHELAPRSRLALAAPSPKAYLGVDDRACGLVVLDRELAGLFDVVTIVEARRQGLAGRLLAGAAAWAARQGAQTLYLQAAEANEAALRLYRGHGFEQVDRYLYAEAPD